MKKGIFFVLTRMISRSLITQTLLSLGVLAQPVILTGPVKTPSGQRVTITGTAPQPMVLEGSADLKSWSALQTYNLTGTPQTFVDSNSAARRFYRMRTQISETGSPSLPDLSTLANQVFPAGEVNTIQYAPNGRLGYLFWKGRELWLRERGVSGLWVEQLIANNGALFQFNANRTDYKFQPPALLLYDSQSSPHVFKGNGNTTVSHYVRNGAAWSVAESIADSRANSSIALLVGSTGPGDVFHLAAVSSHESTPSLTYGVKKNGQWSWSSVENIGAFPRTYLAPSYASRWLSLAVDNNNGAHIVYRPAFTLSHHPQGYVRAYNELKYASNRSGQWQSKIVAKPADISGEAGNGQSIAIGPDNKPYIASWYCERGDGGSSQWSRLMYHQQDASGNWTQSTVLSRPEAHYQAGDGEKGTGFAPYLRFDSRGRPHILFEDHASEHFHNGQSEYAGQVRHGWWNGSQWQFETVHRQTNPKDRQVIYPAFAMSGTELAVTLLERETVWDMLPWIPTVTSTYRFRFMTKPLL